MKQLTDREIAACVLRARMLHPRASFDVCDVMAKDHGIAYEDAVQQYAAYNRRIAENVERKTAEEERAFAEWAATARAEAAILLDKGAVFGMGF